MKKEAIMDVTLLAIIAQKRPDLMDHDDIRLLADNVVGNFEAEGKTGGTPFVPPTKRRRRRRKATNGIKAAAPKRARKKRGRATYTTDIGAD